MSSSKSSQRRNPVHQLKQKKSRMRLSRLLQSLLVNRVNSLKWLMLPMVKSWMVKRMSTQSRWTRFSKLRRLLLEIRTSPNLDVRLAEELRSIQRLKLHWTVWSSRILRMMKIRQKSPRLLKTILVRRVTNFPMTCSVWSVSLPARLWWSWRASTSCSAKDASLTSLWSTRTTHNAQSAAKSTKRQFPFSIHERRRGKF